MNKEQRCYYKILENKACLTFITKEFLEGGGILGQEWINLFSIWKPFGE